jgi:pyridinium-3,5-bisthiocarboxylic acid mononucleotide nickel chelatase
MKILYYECFAGISGDMNLGAMVDLGVDFEYLKNELSKLNIDDEYELKKSKKAKMGIMGTKVDVLLKNQPHSHDDHHQHSHDHHAHTHERKPHGHEQAYGSRNYSDIEKLITTSTLNDKVKKLSIDMFLLVAQAESKVHGKPIEKVHFHEVGATDSIIDIVGAAICYDVLKVDKVISSTIELGSGFVMCDHGKMPVPAPATAEILTDVKTHKGAIIGEATTPTGAAIIKTFASEFSDDISLNIQKVGYGVGTKDFKVPNVLRVSLGKKNSNQTFETNSQMIVETNIDDMAQEYLPIVEQKLFDIGALDVFKTPIMMKKGRSATKLSVLCKKEDKQCVVETLFKQTSTLGVRAYAVDKIMMDRSFVDIKTKYGVVTIKQGLLDGRIIKHKPEFEQIKNIALKNDVSISDILKEVEYEYAKICKAD